MPKKAVTRRSPRSTVALPPTQRTRRSSPPPDDYQDNQQQQRRPPFLKAQHIGHRAMVKFVPGSVRAMQAPWGHQLIVDVTLRGGAVYSWGIGTNKPNLRLLVEHLISNPGKPMELITMQGDRGSFIAIPQEREQVNIDDDDENIPF